MRNKTFLASNLAHRPHKVDGVGITLCASKRLRLKKPLRRRFGRILFDELSARIDKDHRFDLDSGVPVSEKALEDYQSTSSRLFGFR
jgi:hypothetical protein